MSNNGITVETNLTELHKVWSEFRESLPPDVREKVASIFDTEEDWTLPKLNRAASLLMKEIVRGNVHPLAEIQFRAWFDRIMLGLHTQHAQMGMEREAGRSVGAAILSVIEDTTRTRKQFLLPVQQEAERVEVIEAPQLMAENG